MGAPCPCGGHVLHCGSPAASPGLAQRRRLAPICPGTNQGPPEEFSWGTGFLGTLSAGLPLCHNVISRQPPCLSSAGMHPSRRARGQPRAAPRQEPGTPT